MTRRIYDKNCKLRYDKSYDDINMHVRLGKHVSHTYNQPNGCVVDT